MPSLLACLPFLRRRKQTQAKNGGCPSGGTTNSSKVAASSAQGDISLEREGKVSIKIKLSEMRLGQKFTSCVRFGGLTWTLKVDVRKKRSVDWLAVFLRCQPLQATAGKKLEAFADFTLLRKGQFKSPFVLTFSAPRVFDLGQSSGQSWGFDEFKKWNDLMDPAAGFLREGFFTLDAHITVIPLFDQFIDGLTDICLSTGNAKFHANKGVLKTHSAYFDALLSGNFADASKEEIQLQDISPVELKDLLLAIHSPELLGILGAERLEGLLKAADMLSVECVLTRCGALLAQSDCGYSIASRLRLASLYRLPEMYEITAELSKEEIKSLEVTTEWGEISNDAKAALLARIFELNQ